MAKGAAGGNSLAQEGMGGDHSLPLLARHSTGNFGGEPNQSRAKMPSPLIQWDLSEHEFHGYVSLGSLMADADLFQVVIHQPCAFLIKSLLWKGRI